MSDYYDSGYSGLSSMDYWRLADELSVIDAAILITGNNPSDCYEARDEHGDWIRDANGDPRMVQRRNYDGFEAAFKAIRLAILSDKLRATITFRARDEFAVVGTYYVSGEPVRYRREVDADENELHLAFDTMLRASGFRQSIFSNRSLFTLSNANTLYVLKEPAWDETTIAIDDLKVWLSSKGLAPSFFFPQGRTEGFRDNKHSRYSPKLACAVAAWESIKSAKANMSVKGTVEEWVRANAVRFGMAGSDGVPTTKAVLEVSAVVNWATTGGAVPTSTGVKEGEQQHNENIENFLKLYDGENPEIPF